MKKSDYSSYTAYKLAVLRRYKSLVGCSCCGNKDFRVLQFDHRYRHKKRFNVGQARQSLRELSKEISFCDVLCSNCHSIKSWENKDLSTKSGRKDKSCD